MNRPDSISSYDVMDLKLGIKSSLPHVKAAISLAILLWESNNSPSGLQYSEQQGDEIVIPETLFQNLSTLLHGISESENITAEALLQNVNSNQLFKSQMEALMVAFELIWKLAKVGFLDADKPASAERTGRIRYPKVLSYSTNADIIHCVIKSDEEQYLRVLVSWLGFDVHFSQDCEKRMKQLLTALSESAIFKLTDGTSDKVFNQHSIYAKILETLDAVDINGDKEAKGALRILKSLLSDAMNPYLAYNNGEVRDANGDGLLLSEYQQRVDTFLRLSATKVIGLETLDDEDEGLVLVNPDENRITGGTNTLLYGVPGAGKSWTIQHEYCADESRIERLVFHPDYTYSDFIGQILPDVSDGNVTYKFTAGPFTKMLKKAYTHPGTEFFLIIEEINRGNAPAIFGEVFQLLDRDLNGTSEYGITNENIAAIVYGNPEQKVRIPSNMSIVGTMNTSDQNVFTLDTAFQRRWNMRMIENTFENHAYADTTILDTHVTWRRFCEVVNNEIVTKNISMTSSEDKRLGAYFVREADLIYDPVADDENAGEQERIKARLRNYRFAEKVLKYLWDDAFKFSRDSLFKNTIYKSLEEVVNHFNSKDSTRAMGDERLDVFKQEIIDAFLTQETGTNAEE